MHAQGTYGVHKYRSKFIWKMCELLHVVLSSHFFAPTRKDSYKRGEKSLFNKTDFSFRGLGNNTFFFFFFCGVWIHCFDFLVAYNQRRRRGRQEWLPWIYGATFLMRFTIPVILPAFVRLHQCIKPKMKTQRTKYFF